MSIRAELGRALPPSLPRIVLLIALALGGLTSPADAQVGGSVPGFTILPAPASVTDADLSDVFERYVDAYRDPRPLQGWGREACGSYAGVPCVGVLYRCVRDLKWGCPDEEFVRQFVPPFRALVDRMLDDRFATGQGVYLYLGLHQIDEAEAIADACIVSDSWCAMLRSVVAYEQGRLEDAQGGFLRSLEGMPEADRCAFTDLKWLFERSAEYRRLDCSERGPHERDRLVALRPTLERAR